MSARIVRTWSEASVSLARPVLTVFVTGIYNGALLVALFTGMLSASDYILAAGSSQALILGFWFGDRGSRQQDRPSEPVNPCPPCDCKENTP